MVAAHTRAFFDAACAATSRAVLAIGRTRSAVLTAWAFMRPIRVLGMMSWTRRFLSVIDTLSSPFVGALPLTFPLESGSILTRHGRMRVRPMRHSQQNIPNVTKKTDIRRAVLSWLRI